MTASGPDNPLQGIITRCWDDEDFKERLLADPAAVLAAEGVQIPDGVKLHVVVESETERALVVPAPPNGILDDADLSSVHGGWFFDGASCSSSYCTTYGDT